MWSHCSPHKTVYGGGTIFPLQRRGPFKLVFRNLEPVQLPDNLFGLSCRCFLSVIFGKPLITLICCHGLQTKQNNERIENPLCGQCCTISKLHVGSIVTLSSSAFPLGSTLESSRKASSPTKHISWVSLKTLMDAVCCYGKNTKLNG